MPLVTSTEMFKRPMKAVTPLVLLTLTTWKSSKVLQRPLKKKTPH